MSWSSLLNSLKPKWQKSTTKWRFWELCVSIQPLRVAFKKLITTIFAEFSSWIMAIKKLSLWWTCPMPDFSNWRTRKPQATSIGTGKKSRSNLSWLMMRESTIWAHRISHMCTMDSRQFLSDSLSCSSNTEVFRIFSRKGSWSCSAWLKIRSRFHLGNKSSLILQQPSPDLSEDRLSKRKRY